MKAHSTRGDRVKLALPIVATAFLVVWTIVVYPFSKYGDNWAIWPALLVLPLALFMHIYLVVALRPRRPLIFYAVIHLACLAVLWFGSLMLISKDAL
jgi:glycerol-3-phosphate acyltransferase PlsY